MPIYDKKRVWKMTRATSKQCIVFELSDEQPTSKKLWYSGHNKTMMSLQSVHW